MSTRAFRPAPPPGSALLAVLDEWIRRDLQSIFGNIAHEPIPAELAEIVRMIEAGPGDRAAADALAAPRLGHGEVAP
jgi:hypothetical protein